MLRVQLVFHRCLLLLALICCALPSCVTSARGQDAPAKPKESAAPKKASESNEQKDEKATPQNPAQIELLETKIRFEANGDSRKEVHALVHINSELGVRQFARLNFDYNRSFESIEIPLVRITYANGGTSDVLPSAISDNPNPAVVNAPAYQDVRVKSVRILGLQPGDGLEYRVTTTVTKHPLAPDFWLDHSFDRTGVVTQEIFDLDLPATRTIQSHFNSAIAPATDKSGEGDAARTTYHWRFAQSDRTSGQKELNTNTSDISITTFSSWKELSSRLEKLLFPTTAQSHEVQSKAVELIGSISSEKEKAEALYNFVSQKIRTVDLPLGATGFRQLTLAEIMSHGYATQEDKFVLLEGLAASGSNSRSGAVLVGANNQMDGQLPNPSVFGHLLTLLAWARPLANGVICIDCLDAFLLDSSMEVAPFGMVASNFRGKPALRIRYFGSQPPSEKLDWIPNDLPFPSIQKVHIEASLNTQGLLVAKAHYALRGDNELLLRVAFHQTPKEKWKEVAQLLALSDGFRGQVTSVTASDPYATREPFTVEYEISQPKFVDWAKKPVHIPALLPQVGLPDPPTKAVVGSAVAPIELGTPLEVEETMTLHLPPDTEAHYPTGTSVERDYATFSSQYARKDSTVTASRHIHFLLREIPGTRVSDYNAFLRAVQNDSAQDFTLNRAETTPAKTDSAAPSTAAPPNPTAPKP